MSELTPPITQEALNAKRVADRFLFVLIVPLPISFYFGLVAGTWQPFGIATIAIILAIACLVGRRLILQGRIEQGSWWVIGGVLVGLPMATFLLAGLGLVLVLIAILLVMVIATQTLSPRGVTRAALAGVVSGFATSAIDFWGPSTQLEFPGYRELFLVFALVFIIFNVVTIARRFASLPLSTKLILVFLGSTLAPAVILAYVNDLAGRRTLIGEANQRLFAAAAETAARVDSFFLIGLESITQAAQLPAWQAYLTLPEEQRAGSFEETEALALLTALRNRRGQAGQPPVRGYALLDNQGRVVLDTGLFPAPPAGQPLDLSQRDFFNQPFTTAQPYISPVLFVPEVGEVPSLFFAAPVRVPAREPFGVLVARYNANALQGFVATSNGLAGRDSFAVLVDENFTHLAHGTTPEITTYTIIGAPDTARAAELQNSYRLPNKPVNELYVNLPELEENLLSVETQPFFAAEDVATGERLNQVAAARLSKQPSWFILFFQPQDVFLAPAETQTRTTILLAVLLTGFVAIGAIAITNQLTRPITMLTETATRVAAGDLTARASIETADEIGTLATVFNDMTSQLRQTLLGLEARVAERTRALVVSADVGRRLTTILDEQTLVSEVVTQIQDAFKYYHVHIYLWDETHENLILAGGTGEAGRVMLQAGHKIPKGRGLVGRAAETNTTVLVSDVSEDPSWLPNPLLPETQSEAAVPITIGEQVLGVLDVQHNIINGLRQEDADLLQSVANQVAIALQNARTFTQAQRKAEREALLNAISQRIQGASSVDSALKVAIRELGRAVGAQNVAVRLSASSPDDSRRSKSLSEE
ncbi:MAG: GAF domain-containing protein [Chloroflexi bacterium]|nr:GAF domain-containing protein [Chloroflexota bacterium]MCI0578323.1 GAF domain-containing protein [Chloroflexota bacterium]MCI0649009.1 GAF domain-containing protein [Chloroflexota bacterium]MCI0729444.1 GAF domain-containing protein [Chloroflexota bacterium]